jgi:dCMP deaminase
MSDTATPKAKRLEWDRYFLKICRVVAERSTCTRARVGAVIVRNRMILTTGYNGSPAGHPHCTDVGCLVVTSTNSDGQVEENCIRTIHAEINAIAQAAKNGVSIDGADIYITHSPCMNCLKVLLNTGVHRICFEKPYKLERVAWLLEHSRAEMVHVPMEDAG